MLRRSTERYGGSARTARRTNGVVTLVQQQAPSVLVGFDSDVADVTCRQHSMALADEGHSPFQRSCTHCRGSTPAPQAAHISAGTAPGTAHQRNSHHMTPIMVSAHQRRDG